MIVENVYMYKIGRNGNYKSYEGDVYISDDVNKSNASFVSDSGVKFYCSYLEGDVYDNSVWFEQPNKNTALRLLIKEAENKVKKLQIRINGRKRKIEILKNMLKG